MSGDRRWSLYAAVVFTPISMIVLWTFLREGLGNLAVFIALAALAIADFLILWRQVYPGMRFSLLVLVTLLCLLTNVFVLGAIAGISLLFEPGVRIFGIMMIFVGGVIAYEITRMLESTKVSRSM